MPKKTRKAKERAAQRRAIGEITMPPVRPMPEPEETVVEAEPVVVTHAPLRAAGRPAAVRPAAGVGTRAPTLPTFDYSYVYSDLKRIGLLTLLCLAVMFGMAYILQ